MYYPSSENKGADQLRSYCEADLRLCFRLCRLLVAHTMPLQSLRPSSKFSIFFFKKYLAASIMSPRIVRLCSILLFKVASAVNSRDDDGLDGQLLQCSCASVLKAHLPVFSAYYRKCRFTHERRPYFDDIMSSQSMG